MHDHQRMNALRRRYVAKGCLLIAVLISTLGCGPTAPFPVATVEGTVTYQGKPLGHGRVAFLPQAGTPGPAAVGVIGSSGSFQIQTAGFDGAAIGRHLVTVHCRGESIAKEDQNSRVLQIPKSLIPDMYSNTETTPVPTENPIRDAKAEITGLVHDLKEGGSNGITMVGVLGSRSRRNDERCACMEETARSSYAQAATRLYR